MSQFVLTLNAGSSSIKFAVFCWEKNSAAQLTGVIDRIGQSNSTLKLTDHSTASTEQSQIQSSGFLSAFQQIILEVDRRFGLSQIATVGHRVVHGGPRYEGSVIVTPTVISDLEFITPFDPLHLPVQIELLRLCLEQFPNRPQVACFDTAFHRTLPQRSRIFAIPRRYSEQGIRRYGFHGLSFSYLMNELERIAGDEAANGRVILLHLGSGSSMAAVKNRQSIDTTMSLTPTAGLVMGTRCGDIDPGLVLYLQRSEGLSADQIETLLNHDSGLKGISETSSDIRDLLECEQRDVRAADAISIFCYEVSKRIGAFAVALGGIDTIVFAGGIGENSSEVRTRICTDLGFLGISLDQSRNASHAGIISSDTSQTAVRVFRTNEELIILREVLSVLEIEGMLDDASTAATGNFAED